MRVLVKYYLFYLAYFVLNICYGQVYPVQALVQLSPPYTGYLPDYSDPFSEQMKIILTLNDFSVASHTVKIKISVTGSGFSMTTKNFIALPSIELTPGSPIQISGSDLGFYLNSSNLDFSGVNVADYESRKVLPEGMYTVCVKAYDYYSGTDLLLSNEACATAWFNLQDPPYLNLPFCGSMVNTSDPQLVLFNWSPAGLSLPGSFYNTDYQFDLYEVRPSGANANVVVATTLPIYTVTTNQTFVNYGITEPPLQIGMEYVWRVKAVDVSGRDAYKNNGYSQVCTFTYGNLGETIAGNVELNLMASPLGPRLGLANWNAGSSFSNYTLEVRKKGGSYAWFPYSTNLGTIKVTGLEPSTEYECRVKGYNGSFESEYSNIVSFTTLPLPVYACNNTSLPPVEGGAAPLHNLIPGNIFNAGQFEVQVSQVVFNSGTGLFSGYGKVHVPFTLLNFGVYFERIFIDENMMMRGGKVEVQSEGIDAWASDYLNQSDADFVFEGDADSVVLNDNTITIFSNGDTINVNYPGGTFVIEDENGDTWTVYPNGDVEFTPGIPQVYMTFSEKKLYKYAARDIKYEYANEIKLNPILTNYNSKLTSLKNTGQTKIGVNYFDANGTEITNGKIREIETALEGEEVSGFTTAKVDWKTAEVLTRFTANGLNDDELNLLAGFMYIEGVKSIEYVRTRLAAGDSEEIIVSRLKQTIIDFVRTRVRGN